MKPSPITTRRKPANSVFVARVEDTADRGRAGAEEHEHGGEAGDEGQARERDPPPHTRLAELPRLDRGHGRQVAGHERQDAGQDDRDEADREGDRDLAHAVEASKLFVHPAVELRVERCAADRPPPARASASSARPAGRAPPLPSPIPTSGSTQASRLKPCFEGSASTAGPNCATSFALISPFVSPAAIRAVMNCRIRSAIGAEDWSSVVLQVGHITSPSSSPSVGWRSLASAGAASPSASTTTTSVSHDASARLIPAVSCSLLISPWIALADELPVPVDEVRLRETGDSVLGRAPCPGRRGRSGT